MQTMDFRNDKVAAPLKLRTATLAKVRAEHFRNDKVAAPLKLTTALNQGSHIAISATIKLRPH